MEIESSVIETSVDKLVKIVKGRGRIALADVAKELGVSPTVIQEWVEFLEEEGIISVEYSLTKPFLVDRKLTKKEIDEKVKEFSAKKDIFIRKAEVNLNFLKKQAEELKPIKEEFDKLKSELGLELDAVKDDLKELERCYQLKTEMQKQVEEQENDTKSKIAEISRQVSEEQRKYNELVVGVRKEMEELHKEKTEASSIEESEKILNKKLAELKEMVGFIEKRVSDEESAIKNSESHLTRLNSLMEDARQRVAEEKSVIESINNESREQERRVLELQDIILNKLAQRQKDTSNVQKITKKVNDFFEKKLAVMNLVDKINKDRDELEKILVELIKKAKSFQLSSKDVDVGKEMAELEDKFAEVNSKKGIFEEELKKFVSFFRK